MLLVLILQVCAYNILPNYAYKHRLFYQNCTYKHMLFLAYDLIVLVYNSGFLAYLMQENDQVPRVKLKKSANSIMAISSGKLR